MGRAGWVLSMVLALATPALCAAAGLAPWEFGMSKSRVKSFTRYGPYRSFSNGDLETYNGNYAGGKENIQFFFRRDRLHRIGVYLYEGTDATAARKAWKHAYESLAHDYGKIETPGLAGASEGKEVDAERVSVAAAARVRAAGKVQMSPVDQPTGMHVFASYLRRDVQGATYYWVVILLDSRR